MEIDRLGLANQPADSNNALRFTGYNVLHITE